MKNTEILTQNQENIITLQELKDYLEITDDSQDNALENLINAASDYIKNQTGYEWVENEYKEVIDGDGLNSIILSQRPIISIDSIELNNTLLTSDDYAIYNNQGIVTRKYNNFVDGIQNIEVIYTAGYSEVPSDIKQACKEIIKAKTNNEDYEGLSSYSIGDESIDFREENVPPNVTKTISSRSKKRW